jgi:hypothetical protein
MTPPAAPGPHPFRCVGPPGYADPFRIGHDGGLTPAEQEQPDPRFGGSPGAMVSHRPVAHLGYRPDGLRHGRAAPHFVRGGRARRDRSVPPLRGAPVRIHGAPIDRLCRTADSGRIAAGPLRTPAVDRGRRSDHGLRTDVDGLEHDGGPGLRGQGAGGRWGRNDFHQRSATRGPRVSRAARPARQPADRTDRSGGPGPERSTVRSAPARTGMDECLRDHRGPRAVRGGSVTGRAPDGAPVDRLRRRPCHGGSGPR